MPEAKKRFDAGKTIQEKANVLWDVANSLAGLYKPHEYGLVILPMAVVKRFHDCLLPTYAKVQKEYAAKKHLQVKDAFLKAASGYNFYNTSRFSGDAGSGPSEIRRHIIENDWLEAIIQLPNDSFYNTGIATYVWVITKSKPKKRVGKVQLIDASKCCEARRKSIGNKRVDISEACRELVMKAYEDFGTRSYRSAHGTGGEIVVKSHVFVNKAFGYTKIVVESPLVENGKAVTKKGKPVADASKRDTESVPLGEDIEEYMKREVLPYNPEAWADYAKSKVGYEIPFTRTFYEYKPIEKADDVAARIKAHEDRLAALLGDLFGKEAK